MTVPLGSGCHQEGSKSLPTMFSEFHLESVRFMVHRGEGGYLALANHEQSVPNLD